MRVCAAIYAHKAFFHQCYELVKELEPRMARLQLELQVFEGAVKPLAFDDARDLNRESCVRATQSAMKSVS